MLRGVVLFNGTMTGAEETTDAETLVVDVTTTGVEEATTEVILEVPRDEATTTGTVDTVVGRSEVARTTTAVE